MTVGDGSEIGPDLVVEEVFSQNVENFESADQLNGFSTKGKNIISQKADVFHVIEMSVRDKNIIDFSLLKERQTSSGGAGVDEDVLIEKKACGLKTRSYSPISP